MRNLESDLRALYEAVSESVRPSSELAIRATRRARRRRVLTIVATGLVTVALVSGGIGVVSVFSNERSVPPASETANQPGALAFEQIELSDSPSSVTASATAAWMTIPGAEEGCPGGIWKVDADSTQVTQVARLDFFPSEIVYAFGSLWIAGHDCSSPDRGETGVVQRVDPESYEILATIDVGDPASGMAAGEGAIWIGSNADDDRNGRVLRINPATNEVVADIPVEGYVLSVETGEGSVWVPAGRALGGQPSAIFQIDPVSNEVVRTVAFDSVVAGAEEVVAGGGFAWVGRATTSPSGNATFSAVRVDPRTGEGVGDPIDLGGKIFLPFGVDETGIWFISSLDPPASVARLNTSTLEVDRRIEFGLTYGVHPYLEPTSGTIWLADGSAERPRLIRIDTRP